MTLVYILLSLDFYSQRPEQDSPGIARYGSGLQGCGSLYQQKTDPSQGVWSSQAGGHAGCDGT